MQVVSGPYGREKLHYQAPAAERLAEEMNAFLAWFEGPSDCDAVIKAALAHLWYVTIHPFDDGNGRIARAKRIPGFGLRMRQPHTGAFNWT